ncbi:MAG TPA: cation transporter [Elusimicrobia bacterium]|nr:cation transporter [Elusimicrobiota bacterium]
MIYMETIVASTPWWINALLGIVVANLLVWPLTSRWVESHLEIFLLMIGAAAVTISGGWSVDFIYETLQYPVNVAFIVLVVSVIFNNYSRYIFRVLFAFFRKLEPQYSFALLVFLLGITSSLVSVTVAALVLAEVLKVVNLERSSTVRITVFACYAIGLGAVLTPLAEPLGLIINNALTGAPHFADFFFLMRHFFVWIAPAILLLSAAAGYSARHAGTTMQMHIREDKETYGSMLRRTWHIYMFVAALNLISAGLRPLAQSTITHLGGKVLFLANAVSVIIDNATLAAIEIVPTISMNDLIYMVIGLAAFGSMLVQGNLPNIVAAEKLGIKSREWASIAVPTGFVLMGGYFIVLWIVL